MIDPWPRCTVKNCDAAAVEEREVMHHWDDGYEVAVKLLYCADHFLKACLFHDRRPA